MMKETKTCRQCKCSLQIACFSLPRHRICTACKVKQRNAALWFSNPAHSPVVPHVDKTSKEYTNWYHREYYRRNRMVYPEPPLFTPETKLCRRCGQFKPTSEFETYRLRVCMACDGPPVVRE